MVLITAHGSDQGLSGAAVHWPKQTPESSASCAAPEAEVFDVKVPTAISPLEVQLNDPSTIAMTP